MEDKFLELHYYLLDESHSMDALVRNKCEKEALSVLYEIAKHLNAQMTVESFAYQEGGLKEIWKAIGNNDKQLTLLVAIFAILFSCAPKKDDELTALEKEKKQLEIEKLKIEIRELSIDDSEEGQEVQKTAFALASYLEDSGRVSVRRSNFYKHLDAYDKVSAVSFSPGAKPDTFSDNVVVSRRDFSSFILASDKLPSETDENALIEIFSPILVEGSYQWRGFYQGRSISFSMQDSDFKGSVLAKQVKFQNGTRIRCVLTMQRKYNEAGEVAVTGYSVPVVLEVSEGGTTYLETRQGERHRQRKNKANPRQGGLF